MKKTKEMKVKLTKYEHIFNATLDGLILLDKDRKIVDVNNAALEILGYPKKDMLGKGLEIFHTKEYQEVCQKNIEIAEEGKRAQCDCPFIGADGSTIFADNLLSQIEMEEEKFVLVSFHDITQQKEFEDRLEAELQKLRKLNDLMIGREDRIIELKNKMKKMEKDGACDCSFCEKE